jgi:hypothetical protein
LHWVESDLAPDEKQKRLAAIPRPFFLSEDQNKKTVAEEKNQNTPPPLLRAPATLLGKSIFGSYERLNALRKNFVASCKNDGWLNESHWGNFCNALKTELKNRPREDYQKLLTYYQKSALENLFTDYGLNYLRVDFDFITPFVSQWSLIKLYSPIDYSNFLNRKFRREDNAIEVVRQIKNMGIFPPDLHKAVYQNIMRPPKEKSDF